MKTDAKPRNRNRLKDSAANLLSRLVGEKDEKPQMVTVLEEKKTLVRIVKPKPKAVAHRSEVLNDKTLTEDEMKITKSVIQEVISEPKRQKRPASEAADTTPASSYFVCVECGAKVSDGSELCSRCGARYILDIAPESVAELERAQSERISAANALEKCRLESVPVLHFDVLDNLMSFLGPDEGEADFVLECRNCGTLVQLDISQCPMCGTELDVSDVGILSLLKGSEFDSVSISELKCPQCGEHVTLREGICPACHSMIVDSTASPDQNMTIPLIDIDNVVFVHVDLETGGLNYIQKHLRTLALEHTSIQLDGIGTGGFDQDWEGLSRI
ncbi:MAG: zinc ribbon domain-containing protein [Methanobacteriota archaeon]|nr:MAG: zinc ribbon domain-containing protein [Euryarchaeota archaeon]